MLLNYFTDKTDSAANNISTYVSVCVNYVCASRERVKSMCFPYIIKHNFVAKHGNNLSYLSYCLLYLFVWPVSLWVLVILLL